MQFQNAGRLPNNRFVYRVEPKQGKTTMKTVYFVRHGEAEANVQQVLAGARTNTPLTEKGKRQAHTSAEKLKPVTIDLIVSAPLDRAYVTAKIIAGDLGYEGDITVSELFTERDFGSATGLPYAEAGKLLDSNRAIGVEPIPELATRARAALTWVQEQPATTILIVSHGGFGQMFGTVVESKPPADFLSYHHLDNTEYYEFKLGDVA